MESWAADTENQAERDPTVDGQTLWELDNQAAA